MTTVNRSIRGLRSMPQSLVLGTVIFLARGSTAAERDIPVSTLTALPVGVTLPVLLSKALHAGATRVGTKVVMKTTQRVPVGEHLYLPRGAEVLGEVTASDAGDRTPGHTPTLAVRFTALRLRQQQVPLLTNTIAIANFTDVRDTALPSTGATDRGNSNPASWTTTQVGGDEVARSGWVGDVVNTVTHKVGYADYYGVYGLPVAEAQTGKLSLPRAVGVFSTIAQGLYGFDENSTLKSSDGVVTIRGGRKSLVVRGGDNFLLEVIVRPSH